jgi:putative spermidine/putrescine transport system ATP-binding protein/mannopine transport system ATP-binding protein
MADRVAVLDHGCLQQIGSPHDLYENPKTPFVAGFIGETNFMRGRAQASAARGSRVVIVLDGGVTVEGTAVDGLSEGQPVQMAVRPERVAFTTASPSVPAHVDEAIYAGNATTMLASFPGASAFRIRLPAGIASSAPPVGGQVGLQWRAEDARVFGVHP